MITYRHDPEDPYSIADDTINVVMETSNRELLVAGNGGINRFVRDQERFELWGRDFNTDHPLEEEIIYSIEEDTEGRLWIGTYTNGVARWNPETRELRRFAHVPDDETTLSDNLIYDVYQDSKERIWVGTNNGLNLFRPETGDFRRFLHDPEDPDSLSSNTVRSIYEDDDGNLWIATVSGGL